MRWKVLLVDDDPRMRHVLARLLHAAGCDVAGEAGDGEEALGVLGSITPDLIITACTMPRMDGITMVRRLRQGGRCTPVMMLGDERNDRNAIAAIRAGVDNFLPRPIRLDVLIEKIAQTLGTHPTVRAA